MNTDTAPALAALSFCKAGRVVNAWSLLVFLATILVLTASVRPGPLGFTIAVTSLVLACGAMYHTVRLSFDQPVFAAWAQLDGERLTQAMDAFDAARRDIWGGKPEQAERRSLIERVRGVRRLFFRQIVCFTAQVLTLLFLLFVKYV